MKELVEKFVEFANSTNLPIEGIVLSDNKGIIYQHEFKYMKVRNIYSHTKSFISLAIGIAIKEGYLSLDSLLVDVLKDEISKEQYKTYHDVKLRHLLTMTSGIGHGELFSDVRKTKLPYYPSYLNYMLSKPLEAKPGTRFYYSNGDTYLATRMLEKTTNRLAVDYLFDKLLNEMDIPFPPMGVCPMGHCFGASDLFLDIVSMNKFGILCLNKGKYNGKQLVPVEYMDEIAKVQVVTGNDDELVQAYSYFVWFNQYGYRADGAFGQVTFVYPTANLTLSIQCPENGNIALVYKELKERVINPYFEDNAK